MRSVCDILSSICIYPIRFSSCFWMRSARWMTFLIISCSASEMFVFDVFLAGLVEWKDHPEFNL